MARNTFRRQVVNYLKGEYRTGKAYPNRIAVRNDIAQAFDLNPNSLKIKNVVRYDRQARHELAIYESIAVTMPVQQLSYLRSSQATIYERDTSMTSRLAHMLTEIRNVTSVADSYAAQIDTTQKEIRQSTVLRMTLRLLADLMEQPQ
jgi:hypothetical protein